MQDFNSRKTNCCLQLVLALALYVVILAPKFPIVQAKLQMVGSEEEENTAVESKYIRDGMVDDQAQSETILVNPLLQFGSRLIRKVKDGGGEDEAKKNIIFSPVSIHSALNLVLLGSKSGSQTEKELLKTLGYGVAQAKQVHESYSKLIDKIKETLNTVVHKPGQPINRCGVPPPKLDIWTMTIANGAVGKPEPSYLDKIKKYYHSTLKSVRKDQPEEVERVVKDINSWAKEAGFESGVIGPGDFQRDFSLLLLSAVRVEASWFHQFHETDVQDLFYNYGQTDQLVKNGTGLTNSDIRGQFVEFTPDIVSGKNENPRYNSFKSDTCYQNLSKLDFYAVEVKLKGNVSLTCFVPLKNGTGLELEQLESELLEVNGSGVSSKLGKALHFLDRDEASSEIQFIRLPKFRFSNDIALNQPLKSMGLKSIFDPEKAEITEISSFKQYVSEAKHQAMIEVNKVGLKAAGMTTIRMVPLMAVMHRYPIRLIIDRPFLFVVRYNRIPMFMGHLTNLNQTPS